MNPPKVWGSSWQLGDILSMQTREEIAGLLDGRFDETVTWFAQRPEAAFGKGPAGKWTEGQVVDHLILSTRPLNLALRLPRVALKMRFGTAKAPSEPLEHLAARYEAALKAGGKAPKDFVPPAVAVEDKARLLDELREQGRKLVKVVGDWDEADLDRYVLPHPLLGNLTIRNMLQFSYYHMQHHLDILKRDY